MRVRCCSFCSYYKLRDECRGCWDYYLWHLIRKLRVLKPKNLNKLGSCLKGLRVRMTNKNIWLTTILKLHLPFWCWLRRSPVLRLVQHAPGVTFFYNTTWRFGKPSRSWIALSHGLIIGKWLYCKVCWRDPFFHFHENHGSKGNLSFGGLVRQSDLAHDATSA